MQKWKMGILYLYANVPERFSLPEPPPLVYANPPTSSPATKNPAAQGHGRILGSLASK
jgi:hypothetical protein